MSRFPVSWHEQGVRQRSPLHLVPPPRGGDRLFQDYAPQVARLAYRLVGTRFVRVKTQGRVVAVTPHAIAAQLADPFKVAFLLLPPSL